MANKTANILGQAYSFTDATLTISGLELFSCTAFNATVSQEKVNNKGMSNYGISRGKGAKEFSVSMDLSLKDIERLKLIVPGGDLTNMPATICTLLLDNGVDAKHEIVLTAFEFNSDGIEFSDGDTEARRTYEGICADIISAKLS